MGDLETSICQICQLTVAVLVSEYFVSIYRRVSSFTLFRLEGMSPNFSGVGLGVLHSENGDNFGDFFKNVSGYLEGFGEIFKVQNGNFRHYLSK